MSFETRSPSTGRTEDSFGPVGRPELGRTNRCALVVRSVRERQVVSTRVLDGPGVGGGRVTAVQTLPPTKGPSRDPNKVRCPLPPSGGRT